MSDLGIRFRDEGSTDRPVVVLSNSLGTTTDMWDLQVPSMLARYRVIRYEYRGHGGAPSAPASIDLDDLVGDVLDLLDHLEVEQAHLCGLSVGGMVAIRLAAVAPERVQSLILVSTSAELDARGFWIERATAVRRSGLDPIADTIIGRWFTSGFAARHPDRLAWARSMLMGTDPGSYAAVAEMLAAADLTSVLDGIRVPTLIVAGKDDVAIPSSHGARLAAGIDASSIAILDEAAHLANIEQAPRFTRLALQHLRTADTQSA